MKFSIINSLGLQIKKENIKRQKEFVILTKYSQLNPIVPLTAIIYILTAIIVSIAVRFLVVFADDTSQ